jgi:hypothetical protein
MELMQKTCRVCQIDKPAQRLGRLSEKGFIYYADDQGQLWLGSMCPSCAKIDRQKYRKKKHFSKRICTQCNTEYTPDRKTSKFCSERCGIVFHSLERTRKKHRDKDIVQVLPEGEQPIKLEIQLTKAGKKRKQKLHDIEEMKKQWDIMTEGLTMEQVKDALNGYRESIVEFETKESIADFTQEELDSLPHIKIKST